VMTPVCDRLVALVCVMVEMCAGGRRWKPSQHQRVHLQNVREGNSAGELHVSDEAGPEPRSVTGASDLQCIGKLTAALYSLYCFCYLYTEPSKRTS